MGDWGKSLCLITVCDVAYLPGAYALFNSARANGYIGNFEIVVSEGFNPAQTISANGLRYRELPNIDKRYHSFVNRIEALVSLPPGNYCYLDSDVLIERPAGIIFGSINDGLLVSTEAGRRFDPRDVWVREQCVQAGLPWDLPDYPYVNSGLLGFQIPRDQEFLTRLLRICRRLFLGCSGMMENTLFPFLDQDVMNLLVRDRLKNGGSVFSVSPRRVEIGLDRTHWNRRFPHTAQGGLKPEDQLKFLIHGASLRRPWVDAARPGVRGVLESSGILPMRRKLLGGLTPYERGWAFYACGQQAAISPEMWTPKHRFQAHRNRLWRLAFDL